MKITNKRAYFDYTILESVEAGIQLTGAEVKSVKAGHVKLEGSYVRIIGGEAYLVNAEILPNQYAASVGYDPKRSRKLLLHKNQLITLGVKSKQKRLTLIPLSCYTTGHLIKLAVGLGKGKKEYDRREEMKKRDIKREVERVIRGKG